MERGAEVSERFHFCGERRELGKPWGCALASPELGKLSGRKGTWHLRGGVPTPCWAPAVCSGHTETGLATSTDLSFKAQRWAPQNHQPLRKGEARSLGTGNIAAHHGRHPRIIQFGKNLINKIKWR